MGLSMPSLQSSFRPLEYRVSTLPFIMTSKHLNCGSAMFNVSIISAVARKQGGECEAGDRVGHAQAGLGENTEETRHIQSKGSFHVSFSFLSLEPAFIFIYLSWNLYH